MSVPQDTYVARETAISVAINMVLSAAFFVALFHGRTPLAWWGADRLVIDFLPQTFMVTLMGALVPSLLTRRRVRSGAVAFGAANAMPSIGSVIGRALLMAVIATLVFGGGAIAVVSLLDLTQISFAAALILKIVFGALLALIATPIALRMTLRRDMPRGALQ
jgi:hypothetical protein